MKRRVLSLALTAMMPSAAMVGCGSGGNDSNSGTNNSTEGKTLELYYQKTNVDQFQKIVEQMTMKKTQKILQWSSMRLLLILQNRCFKQEWPQKNTWISYNIGPRRRNSDFRLRLGLSRIYQMKIWVDNVVESYKEISSVDGKLYSLPLAANTHGGCIQ